VVQRIRDIERRSWKEHWRSQTRTTDQDLSMILRGAKCTSESEPGFGWSTSFLDLDGKALAYALLIEYKGVAYLAKTSFDERSRRLNVGSYVINEAIHELFDKAQAKTLDFITDLPFMKRWTSVRISRIRIVMSRKGPLPTIIGFLILHANDVFGRIWRLVHIRQA
jgi:hypothetical protein